MNFIIQKLKNKHIFLIKLSNWAKLNSLILREQEETITKYFAPKALVKQTDWTEWKVQVKRIIQINWTQGHHVRDLADKTTPVGATCAVAATVFYSSKSSPVLPVLVLIVALGLTRPVRPTGQTRPIRPIGKLFGKWI